MRKRFLSRFLLTFFYIVLFPAVIFAQNQHVFDTTNALSDSEKNILEERIAAIKSDYNFTVVIATEQSIGDDDIETYGDGFYEKNGFDSEIPGVLLFLVIDDRQYYINAYGESPYTDVVNDEYEKYFLQYLIVEPALAYNAFLDDVEQYLNPTAPQKYIADHSRLLSDDDKSALEERIAAIKKTYDFNVVIVTEEHIAEKYVEIYADEFFFSGGFGANGVLLLWNAADGWTVWTYGTGPMGGRTLFSEDALREAGRGDIGGYLPVIDDVENTLKIAYTKIYVNDGAHLMTDSQVSALNERIAAIRNAYDFDVVLVTEETIRGWEPMDYADDFFDYRGGGFGNGENGGVLLLWVTDTRWAWFSGYGLTPLGGETVFNEFTISASDKHLDKYLKADEGGVDDIYGMYNGFLDDVELYLGLAAKGRHYNILHEYLHVFLIIGWAVALLIALITVSVWKKGMNTAKGSGHAAAYIVPESLKFAVKTDTFLYSTVSKTLRQSSSSSSGGHSRSSSHRSSSGRSHSGGGGRH